MAFEYTEEQQTLQQTVRRSFTDTCTSEFLRGLIDGKNSSDSIWSLVSELGLFEFFADPEGPSLVELSLISFEAGKVLLPNDVAGALFWGPFLAKENTEYSQTLSAFGVIKAQLENGEQKIGIGIKTAKGIDFVSPCDAPAVVYLTPNGAGIAHASGKGAPHACLDLTCARFSYAALKEQAIIEESIPLAWHVLVASELAGIAQRSVEMTQEYVKTRKQFGAAIGSFQAVQQQLADAYLKSESLISLVQFAAWTYSSSREQLPLAAKSALGFAIDVVPLIVETAIQLHGGIGFTWEYDLHLYLRRARMLSALYALDDSDYETILTKAAASGSQ